MENPLNQILSLSYLWTSQKLLDGHSWKKGSGMYVILGPIQQEFSYALIDVLAPVQMWP